MTDLVCGIVPMGSEQIAEFQWVSPQEIVTPVDIQLIENQLTRFRDSLGHMLHAKIVADTRDGDVAWHLKKSSANIIRHAGNLRKYHVAKQQQATVAKAAMHVVGKPDAVAKPAAKPHPAAEPPAGLTNSWHCCHMLGNLENL
jgi:hypothetical protein